MKILAIDTSQKTVSIAVVADDMLRAEIFVKNGRHHSEILMPAVEQALRLAGLQPDEMDFFAVTVGPGSFTGLRIGAATIKGLALSTGKPVVGVSTLDALAFNAALAGRQMVCPMLDAQKNQIYSALYRSDAGLTVRRITAEQVVDVDQWLKELKGDIFFLGDGAVKYAQRIHTRYASAACIAEGHQNHVRASAAAVLARDQFLQGQRLDLLTFAPCYLRFSEAERSLRQKTSEIDKP
ncbi:MAG: tRNA (adenosine(37)-N6)-threonylcarbamoyltransferase complex dimerization subunit type 1 TsaB [Pseudomonadota bacterium]